MPIKQWLKSGISVFNKASGLNIPSYELHFSNVIRTHYFEVKTLEEAQRLAVHISSLETISNRTPIELGLHEIIFNAIEHGNLGITHDEKTKLRKINQWETEVQRRIALPYNINKTVEVHVEMNPSYLCVTVKDQGEGFNWRKYIQNTDPRAPLIQNGRGLIIARDLCFDDLIFSEKGNIVKCYYSLEQNTFDD